MSTIIAKAFDATKKVVRTVFKGAPNLFTTSDLNRQIEALKYQADFAQLFLHVVSNVQITGNGTYNNGDIEAEISFTGGYAYAVGALFEDIPAYTWQETLQGVTKDTRYAVIVATLRELEFSDDLSHDVVGAKFMDNTSRPAANQIVYENISFAVKTANELRNLIVNGQGIRVIAIMAEVSFSVVEREGVYSVLGEVVPNCSENVIPTACKDFRMTLYNFWYHLAEEGQNSDVAEGDSIAKAIAFLRYKFTRLITKDNIADDAIVTDKIEDGSVTKDKLASNSVETEKIKDGNVTINKLENLLLPCTYCGPNMAIVNTGVRVTLTDICRIVENPDGLKFWGIKPVVLDNNSSVILEAEGDYSMLPFTFEVPVWLGNNCLVKFGTRNLFTTGASEEKDIIIKFSRPPESSYYVVEAWEVKAVAV